MAEPYDTHSAAGDRRHRSAEGQWRKRSNSLSKRLGLRGVNRKRLKSELGDRIVRAASGCHAAQVRFGHIAKYRIPLRTRRAD